MKPKAQVIKEKSHRLDFIKKNRNFCTHFWGDKACFKISIKSSESHTQGTGVTQRENDQTAIKVPLGPPLFSSLLTRQRKAEPYTQIHHHREHQTLYTHLTVNQKSRSTDGTDTGLSRQGLWNKLRSLYLRSCKKIRIKRECQEILNTYT